MKLGRSTFAWMMAGSVAFIVYGSFVPFHFRARPVAEVADRFIQVLSAGITVVSRSDAAANVLLGAPLGFALLGFVSVDRNHSRRKITGFGLLLLPVCVLFSALVECAQLWTVDRFCAVSDIAAQAVGAAAGMVVWVLGGQWLTGHARVVWNRTDGNAVGRLLIAYLALLAFIQMLPLDLTASAGDLYRKLRDTVRFTPFSEFDGLNDTERWKHFAKLMKLAGLYLPVGLLAAQLKGRTEQWNLVYVALASVAVALCIESLQLVVKSRTPSATDVLVGAAAAMIGWYAARVHHEGLALPFAACWGIVWLAAMTPITQPVAGTARLEAPRPFDWVPGLPLESGDPLFALEEMLTKLVLFGLLGVLVAAWRLPPARRGGPRGSVRIAFAIAGMLGLALSAFFESGQRWYDTHTPCITDVLLGSLGAALGVLAATRARGTR